MHSHPEVFVGLVRQTKASPLSHLAVDDIVKFHDQDVPVASPLYLTRDQPDCTEPVPETIIDLLSDDGTWK